MRDTTNSSLKLSLVNARSLVSDRKLSDLETFISEHSIDILACTETWFNSHNITDALLSFNGSFSVIKADREGKKGGGVLLLIRRPMKYIVVSTFSTLYIIVML